MTTIDYKELKKGGFIRQVKKDYYIMRLRTKGGNMTSEQIDAVSVLAKKYGRGYVHFTTRQGVEIPYIHINDYENIRREVEEFGLLRGACGPKIRSVIACPGEEVCSFGLINSRELGSHLDEVFFGREIRKKTKMAIAGCPNSCSKPQENDIGFIGAVEPEFVESDCTGCGVCEKVCPADALKMVDGKPVFDEDKCIHEGNCIASCPTDAWKTKRKGIHAYAGGKIGRFPQLGTKIVSFVPEDKLIDVAEAIVLAYNNLGEEGERIANTLNRVGKEEFVKEVEKGVNLDE